MSENKTLEIIKKAILLEHRGKALYESVSPETACGEFRELFGMLAEEEKKHIDVLNQQFKALTKGQPFDVQVLVKPQGDTPDEVLTEKIIKGISAAGYEAALIAAALDFEKAVEFYSLQIDLAETDEEKQLFRWLTEWEKGHMTMLAKIDREIMESIWYDNNFWPLD